MKKSKRVILFTSSLLFISVLIAYETLTKEQIEKKNEENIIAYYNEKEIEKEHYLGILSIPSIKLKRGFYDELSSLNQVNKNILVVYDKMPNILVLAAHRGNSSVSFFNNLDQMKMGDSLFLDYQHVKREYLYLDHYMVEKNGNVPLSYDKSKKTLVLITCSKKDKQKQIIYLAYEKRE